MYHECVLTRIRNLHEGHDSRGLALSCSCDHNGFRWGPYPRATQAFLCFPTADARHCTLWPWEFLVFSADAAVSRPPGSTTISPAAVAASTTAAYINPPGATATQP